METANKNIPDAGSRNEAYLSDSILEKLILLLKYSPSQTDDVKTECDKVRETLQSTSDLLEGEKIKPLISLCEAGNDNIRRMLFSLFEVLIPRVNKKLIPFEHLLSSNDKDIVISGLNLMKVLLGRGEIEINRNFIEYLEGKYENLISYLGEKTALKILSEIIDPIHYKSVSPANDPVLEIYLNGGEKNLRVISAKIIDLRGIPVSEESVKKLFGTEAAQTILSYLLYTRASYEDLINLIPSGRTDIPIVDSLKECEALCPQNLIREAIARSGWKAVNYGLSVKHYAGVSLNGCLPLFSTVNEAILLEKTVGAGRTNEYYVFTAHGAPVTESNVSGDNKPVALFRSYNLAHAKLLEEILDIVPLTPEKVKGIINQLDSIVSDFITLFSRYTEECKILPDVYGKIRNKIITELGKNSVQQYLSADVTRLVQMFEDPHSLGEVHTLHGLKRYLHQRGLQLGFKLVDRSRSPNQCISLILCTSEKVLTMLQKINFADFEPAPDEKSNFTEVPFPIKIVIDGFSRQLLYGQESFPSVNIFCYGNEVHYFVWFRNHPVFIRIDYSPPLHGGMIDLQYFGVSNYEIADHPNIYLDAIKYFFQFLEFDVKVEGTHIQARYDKERALHLGQLCERAEYLFCFSVYLMDLDWIIGSLNITDYARKKVIKAWAAFFVNWGILPVNRLLSKDKLGIIQKIISTPEGDFQQLWPGEGEYRDRFSIEIPGGFFDKLYEITENLGLKIRKFTEKDFNQIGQLYLEKKLFNHIREALAEGKIKEISTGLERTTNDLFQDIHEVHIFKEIISCRDERLKSAVILAKNIIPLEQTLKFQTTGTLGSFSVQSAELPLRGRKLKIFVLRDFKGLIRLAFFISERTLYQKRKSKNNEWGTNAEFSNLLFMSLLRYNNYNVSGPEPSYEEIEKETQIIIDELSSKQKTIIKDHTPGEKIIYGLRAAPGRTAGRVLLGTAGRLPEDFHDHIFVASSVSPEDNTILFHSAGVVATSGGILSHAGLIATQFNKPAIIIPGEWVQKPDGTLFLIYRTSEYEVDRRTQDGFDISVYYDLKEQEYQLRDGDLVVLDANEGSLLVMGQDRDSVSLFEDLKALGRTNEDINRVTDAKELLLLRGRKLHIRHRIEKLLRRITDPVLVSYAVREVTIGNFLEGSRGSPDEKAYLLSLLTKNDKTEKLAENYLIQTAVEIKSKFDSIYNEAQKNIPLANYPYEVVMLRLRVLQINQMIKNVIASLSESPAKKILIEAKDTISIDIISFCRMMELRNELKRKITSLAESAESKEYLRHLFRQAARIDLILNTPEEHRIKIDGLRSQFEDKDKHLIKELETKLILTHSDGALELAPMIGWKAANLAELVQLGGEELIPSWYAVTDKAFQRTLDTGISESCSMPGEFIIKGIPLREAIDRIIANNNINNREKSLQIRKLWESIALGEDIKKEIADAYSVLEDEYFNKTPGKKSDSGLFVAIRSSSCEEDAEIAARAGEFETYLYIHGKYSLIEYLKKTWSGLWTERAIHNRAIIGHDRYMTKGGVIVQRIVNSRISGVVQTINVAKGELKEIVINAGLGLGEGIVSGRVAADQIIVYKEGDLQNGPLHFSYMTADKKDQVVYNNKAGFGTVITSTLYHQRFRPALEYVELCELVAIASRLENAYGYPLDIEFGIEDTRLWILQVRPVATFLPALKETIEFYPLSSNIKTENKEELR